MSKMWYYKVIQWKGLEQWHDCGRVFAEVKTPEEAKEKLDTEFERVKGGFPDESRLSPILFGSWETRKMAEENKVFCYL